MVGRLETLIFASHLTVTDLRRLIVGVKNAGPPPIPGPRAGPGATPDRQYWGCLRQWPTPRDRKRPMPGETSLCWSSTRPRHRGLLTLPFQSATTWVPARPSTIASISPREPMAALFRVPSTNKAAASTFGPSNLQRRAVHATLLTWPGRVGVARAYPSPRRRHRCRLPSPTGRPRPRGRVAGSEIPCRLRPRHRLASVGRLRRTSSEHPRRLCKSR
jgi:hypothetical protein